MSRQEQGHFTLTTSFPHLLHITTSTSKKFWKNWIKCRDELVKKNGDKVGMRVCSSATTICPMQQPQATPAYISIHVVYNLYWTWLNQSGCIRNAKLKHSYPNGQFLQTQAKLHGTYGGRSWIPTLSPYFFRQFIPTFYFIFSNF